MEPDVVVSMAKSLQHEGIKFKALVADDVLLLYALFAGANRCRYRKVG